MSTITTEQYMGLSALVNNDLSTFNTDGTMAPNSIKYIVDNSSFGLNPGTPIEFLQQSDFGGNSVNYDGWKMIHFTTSESGLAAAAFQAPDGQIVFAFRGTEPSDITGDVRTDILMSMNFGPDYHPQQFDDAIDFVNDVMADHVGANYTFTGHSLGGAIAQYATFATDHAATTFDAPGIGQSLVLTKPASSYAVNDYTNSYDVIGSIGVQLGTTHYYDYPTPVGAVEDLNYVSRVMFIYTAKAMGLISEENAGILINNLVPPSDVSNMSSPADAVDFIFASHELKQLLNYNTATGTFSMPANVGYTNVSLITNGVTTASILAGVDGLVASIITNPTTAPYTVLYLVDMYVDTVSSLVQSFVGTIMETAGVVTDFLDWATYLYNEITTGIVQISGTGDIDYLSGTNLAGNTIQGYADDDHLFGGVGNDIIVGGTGNDYMEGGTGNDVYRFELGDGQDTIYDTDNTTGNVDTIVFGDDIGPEDVKAVRVGDDLQLRITGTSDIVTIKGYFSQYGGSHDPNWNTWSMSGTDINVVERIVFSDTAGTVWDESIIKNLVRNIDGTSGDDGITGFLQDNIVSAGNGDDSIYMPTASGDNVILAGNGNDYVTSGMGNDTIMGGDGNDTITAGAGNDVITGDAGDDTIDAGAGNDTIVGGIGNDHLVGGAGNDAYLFSSGFGQDTIYDSDATVSNVDTIQFSDINSSDATIWRSDKDLIISFSNSTDTLTVQGFFTAYSILPNPPYYTPVYVGEGANRIEQLVFADNVTWNVTTIMDKARYAFGTSGDDTIVGYSDQDDIISAGAGVGNYASTSYIQKQTAQINKAGAKLFIDAFTKAGVTLVSF